MILRVRVTPRSGRSELVQVADGTWKARLKAPPADGKANAELVALIATYFDCPKSEVKIKSGTSGRVKLVAVGRP